MILAALALSTTQTQTELPVLYSALSGAWIGTLEYRDYSDDKRYRLATMLRVTPSKDGRSISMRFVYDDGPDKIEQSRQRVTIDEAAKTYTVAADGEAERKFQVVGLDKLKPDGTGRLVLTGDSQESGKTVVVRYSLDIGPNSLAMRRDTGASAESLKFRNEYRFTRVRNPSRDDK